MAVKRTGLGIIVAAGLATLALGAGPASAHDSIASSDPASGSTIDDPISEVTIDFGEGVANPEMAVFGPDDEIVESVTVQISDTAARAEFDELQTEIDGFEKKLEEMRSQAEERAEQDAAALMARAEQDAERIRETAQRSIRDETTRARAALRREAAVLGVELAEKKVSSEFAVEDEARLAGEFLGKVSNGGGHG